MKIRILGTAAGGGLPQWNCACPGCDAARATGFARRQDTLAVSGDGNSWYLLNAAPDLRLDTPELRPGPGPRETPLRGVILTSAELDHTIGLVTLREAAALTVYATEPILAATPALPLLTRYTALTQAPLARDTPVPLEGGLTVTAFALGTKPPRYATTPPSPLPATDPATANPLAAPAAVPPAAQSIGREDWVVGLMLSAGTASAIYAPCLPAWSERLVAADLVILDGTFFADDELERHTGVRRTARQMGHLPIEESLPRLASHPGPRYLYTHLNNTNPAAHPGAPELALLRAHGADVAPEGELLSLGDDRVSGRRPAARPSR